MSKSATVDSSDVPPGSGEDGVFSPADSADQVVNCSVNHSTSAAVDMKDAELGGKSQASPAAVNTVVRYRSECHRWSNLERYLIIVCVVLLLATIALAVITLSFTLIKTGKSVQRTRSDLLIRAQCATLRAGEVSMRVLHYRLITGTRLRLNSVSVLVDLFSEPRQNLPFSRSFSNCFRFLPCGANKLHQIIFLTTLPNLAQF